MPSAQLGVLGSLLALLTRAEGEWALTPSSAWYVDPSASGLAPNGTDWFDPLATPVKLALRDLKRDWYKVVGVPPTVLESLPSGHAWDGDVVVVFALASPHEEGSSGAPPPETFNVTAVPVGTSVPTLRVTGADMRGLIFGIYHVSADFLGVDPQWWFNDVTPAYEPSGIAVASSYAYESGAPAFDSRGGFNNDEDLSGYFASSPLSDAVYGSEFTDKFCEALLRMRVNTFIPSTFAFIDESHYRVAAKRGLRLGNHHIMPMGNNVFAWPKGVSYSYRLSPAPFHAAWSALADYAQNIEGREMVYSLGYRGVRDSPFWYEDTGCTTDECRGATISQAITNQSSIAMTTPYAIKPRLVSYMWMELLQLKEVGTLVLPPDVSCIWTDYPGAFLFSGGFDNVSKNDGFYGHIAMMNNAAGQLTEFIPPARIFANVWQFWKRAATAYGMINLSDLKFVPLTAEAIFRYMWSPDAFNASETCTQASIAGGPAPERNAVTGRRGHLGVWPTPRVGAHGCSASDFGGVTPLQAQEAFILEFSQRHYGEKAGTVAAGLYTRYFNISYMADAVTGEATKADHYLGVQLRALVDAFRGGSNNASLRSAALHDAAFAQANLPFVAPLWADVEALGATLPPGSVAARFFAAHLTAQTAIHYHHLVAFNATTAGALALLANDVDGAAAHVRSALSALDALLGVLRTAEGTGTWHGAYAADGYTWCWGSRQSLAALVAWLEKRIVAEAPVNPHPHNAIMTYETPSANDPLATPSFPFFKFNASVAWDVVPRFDCASALLGARPSATDVGATHTSDGTCESSWVGVTISGGAARVGFFTATYNGPGARMGGSHSVHYTIDDSPPTASSPVYTAPLSLGGNCTVRARSFDDVTGESLGVEVSSVVMFKKPS